MAGTDEGATDRAADPAEIGTALRDMLALATRFERKLGRALSVNPTDLRAMEHLIASGALTPTDLAGRLGISTAASTLVVDRLTELGHVRRGPHPDDRRRVLVRAEPASEERALAEVQPMVDGVRRAIGALSADERATVLRFLDDVRGVYRDAVGEIAEDAVPPRDPARAEAVQRPCTPRSAPARILDADPASGGPGQEQP